MVNSEYLSYSKLNLHFTIMTLLFQAKNMLTLEGYR